MPDDVNTVMTISDFISQNLLASYGAAVGTLALALNFMRYRHAISNSKTRLKIEVLVDMSEGYFEAAMNPPEDTKPWKGDRPNSLITHKIKIRNVGGVTAHIQDVWVQAQNGKKNATVPSNQQGICIYRAVSERGNVEIAPRSSQPFFVFSDKEGGYLKIKRAYAIDETGRQWRS